MLTTLPTGTPPIDLGDEPPLVTFDARSGPPTRREISLRWLIGTVLTGVTSMSLIGGALFAALDGQYSVQAAPSRDIDELAATSPGKQGITKGNRATRSVAQFSNRQIIQVNTVTREGERAHIRAKPYQLVTASLATRKSNAVAARIPPFNPLKIFSDTELFPDRAGTDSIYSARIEGEVTIAVRDFPLNSPCWTRHRRQRKPKSSARCVKARAFCPAARWMSRPSPSSIRHGSTSTLPSSRNSRASPCASAPRTCPSSRARTGKPPAPACRRRSCPCARA
ncbi:hypothetical protein [Breoghania sp. L-A4]|uniref:hypothetical protein n=1 Tax=Breoghania sp. L-A4 TaxID=2304600 RepID=UPI001968800C|nr:hypothetical protein [Breoghania sp. L-A4]